jgi:hypothetical protein
MVGTAVRDSKGQPVGEIKDVMIDWSDKQMTFAVLDPSGAVGLGHRFLAVAPAALNYSAGGGNLVVNTTRDRLASAPGFDRTAWPSASDKDFVRQTDRFYNRDSD